MTTDNRRKAEKSKAKTKESGESLVPLLNGAMVDKAERKISILPNDQNTYIVTMENVVDNCNIKEATDAVRRNRGAPGIDGITTEGIEEVMQKQWPQIKQDIRQKQKAGVGFNV